jgi:hypothetical protein
LDFKAKKIRFIETEFFVKGKTGNSGGEKETWEAGREIFFFSSGIIWSAYFFGTIFGVLM